MRTRLRRLAPFLSLLVLALWVPPGAHGGAGSALDEYFTRLEAHGFSGSVLVARGPQILLRKGYGFADRKRHIPNRPDTAFNIASLDKQFIAAGILRLEEQGKLRVADPLERFFDGLPEDKRGITLHQVLSHTAGFPDEYWDEHEAMTRAEFLRWVFRERPLLAPPGSRWSYASFDYWLLEEVIERVSGMPFEAYLRRELFDPAGLPWTGFALPRWRRNRIAHMSLWTIPDSALPGEARFIDPLARPPAWRILLSTVDDLHRWYLALRDGKALSAESRRKLFTPVMENYAYGWNVVPTARGTRLIHHGGGGGAVGSVATFRWFADEDLFVALLNNSLMDGFSTEYVMADVEALLFGGEGAMPPAAQPLDPIIARQVTGTYRLPGGGTIEVLRAPGGPLVARSLDEEGTAALRFGGTEGSLLPPDRLATEVLGAWAQGDFGPLERSCAGNPAKLREWAAEMRTNAIGKRGMPLVGGALQAGAATTGGDSTAAPAASGIATLHSRTFTYEGEREVQAYLRVPFERGAEVFRVIHLPSGKLAVDPVRLPPGIEAVLAPAAGGGYTAWNPRLALGLRLRFEGEVLRLTGSGGSVAATRIAKEPQ